MALTPNRHIDGAGLLECLMRMPSQLIHKFLQDAPRWFFDEVAGFFQIRGSFIPVVIPFVHQDIKLSQSSTSPFPLASAFLPWSSRGLFRPIALSGGQRHRQVSFQ
jgi:hypothetical protein